MSRPTSLIITCIDPNKRSPSPATSSYKTCSEGSDNNPQKAYSTPSSTFDPQQSAKTVPLNRKNTLGSLKEAVNGDGSSSATTGSSRNVSDSTAPTSVDPDTPTKPKTPAIDPTRLRGELNGVAGTPRRQYSVEDTPVIENGSTDQEDQPSAPTVLLSENAGSGEGASQLAESESISPSPVDKRQATNALKDSLNDHPPAPSNVESKTISPNEGPSSSTEPGHVNNLSATLVPEPESRPSDEDRPPPGESESVPLAVDQRAQHVSESQPSVRKNPTTKRSKFISRLHSGYGTSVGLLKSVKWEIFEPIRLRDKLCPQVQRKKQLENRRRNNDPTQVCNRLKAEMLPAKVVDVRLKSGLELRTRLVCAFPGGECDGKNTVCVGLLAMVDNGNAAGLRVDIGIHPGVAMPDEEFTESTTPPRFVKPHTRKAKQRSATVEHGVDKGAEAEIGPEMASGSKLGAHDNHTKAWHTVEESSNKIWCKAKRYSADDTIVHLWAKENRKEHKGVDDRIPIFLEIEVAKDYRGPIMLTVYMSASQGWKTLDISGRAEGYYGPAPAEWLVTEEFGVQGLGDVKDWRKDKDVWAGIWHRIVNA